MIWVAIAVVMLAVAICAWWLGTLGSAGHARPAARPHVRPAQGNPEPRRLGLPPGPEGHLMAAEALHRATGMYRDACASRIDER